MLHWEKAWQNNREFSFGSPLPDENQLTNYFFFKLNALFSNFSLIKISPKTNAESFVQKAPRLFVDSYWKLLAF